MVRLVGYSSSTTTTLIAYLASLVTRRPTSSSINSGHIWNSSTKWNYLSIEAAYLLPTRTTLESKQTFSATATRNQQQACGFSLSSSSTTARRHNNDQIVRFSSAVAMASSTPLKQMKVLVPISDGSEEIETTCIQDILVRFGAKVTVASIKPNSDLICTMSRGIKIAADCTIVDALQDPTTNEYDMIILPGGMPGAEHLRDCKVLIDALQKQKSSGKWYGAICAAPAVALQPNGLFDDDMNATCYPAPKFREAISNYMINDDSSSVVVSKNCVTSQGPGTAIEFGLTLGELLYGKEKRDEIAKALLVA